MGKVVKLEPTAKRRPPAGPSRSQRAGVGQPGVDRAAPPAAARQDRAGPRRGRFHGRRVRDRRPAGAGSAGRQQHGQQLRRLRRHLGGLVHRRPVRQRRHPRGDDAGRHAPGQAAVQGHRHRRPAAAELRATTCARASRCPCVQSSIARQMLSQPGGVSLMDVVIGLADGLPSGIYNGCRHRELPAQGPERARPHRRVRRARLRAVPDGDRPRHLRAGRLRGRGVDGSEGVPISTAVRASGALPMVYAPVRVHDRDLIDGGIVSTTNLDLAIQAGAKLVVVINPIVPFVNDFTDRVRTLRGLAPAAHLRHGLRADRLPGLQARRPPAPARTRQGLGGALPRRRHRPDRARTRRRADVPDLDDELHLARGDRPSRLRVGHQAARRANTTATRRSPSATASRSRPSACARSSSTSTRRPKTVSAWRKILEGTTSALLRQAGSAAADP